MIDKSEKRHNNGIEALISRLETKGYDAIFRCAEYLKGGQVAGELDVMALRGNNLHYYEIKCTDSEHSLTRATNQIYRLRDRFPNLNVKGIYVPLKGGSPKRVI